jgi:hypothetical protein
MTRAAFEGLELYEWKLSCTVLKGEGGRKAPDLPGCAMLPAKGKIAKGSQRERQAAVVAAKKKQKP